MDFLIELIGEIVENAAEHFLKSRRIPRIVRLLFVSACIVPFIVLFAVLCISALREGRTAAALGAAFCALICGGLELLAVRGIWK